MNIELALIASLLLPVILIYAAGLILGNLHLKRELQLLRELAKKEQLQAARRGRRKLYIIEKDK